MNVYTIKLDQAQTPAAAAAWQNVCSFLSKGFSIAKWYNVFEMVQTQTYTVIQLGTTGRIDIPSALPDNCTIELDVLSSAHSKVIENLDKAILKRGDYIGMISDTDITDELDDYVKIGQIVGVGMNFYFGVANSDESETYSPTRTATVVCRINSRSAVKVQDYDFQRARKNIAIRAGKARTTGLSM